MYCRVLGVPYGMPDLVIRYTNIVGDVPVEREERVRLDVFFHAFFTYSSVDSVDSFRHAWCMMKYTSRVFVSDVFVGKFDIVKGETQLKRMFPGIVYIDKKEYKESETFVVPFFQYGMVMNYHTAGGRVWIMIHIDMSNSMFIEFIVDSPGLVHTAHFLLQHLVFILSE